MILQRGQGKSTPPSLNLEGIEKWVKSLGNLRHASDKINVCQKVWSSLKKIEKTEKAIAQLIALIDTLFDLLQDVGADISTKQKALLLMIELKKTELLNNSKINNLLEDMFNDFIIELTSSATDPGKEYYCEVICMMIPYLEEERLLKAKPVGVLIGRLLELSKQGLWFLTTAIGLIDRLEKTQVIAQDEALRTALLLTSSSIIKNIFSGTIEHSALAVNFLLYQLSALATTERQTVVLVDCLIQLLSFSDNDLCELVPSRLSLKQLTELANKLVKILADRTQEWCLQRHAITLLISMVKEKKIPLEQMDSLAKELNILLQSDGDDDDISVLTEDSESPSWYYSVEYLYRMMLPAPVS